MNNTVKTGLLSVTLTLLTACASTQSDIDYSSDVDTPDVLIQDAQGGDSEYGLDKNADKHNQQNKPDMLEQSVGGSNRATPSSRTSTQATRPAKPEKSTQDKQQSKQRSAPIVVQQTPKANKKAKVEKANKEPTKQESALEVDDPLLGEIDPT